MTKYIARILKQLGIDYQEYDIHNHWDEESGATWITLHSKSDWKMQQKMVDKLDALYQRAYGKYQIYWDKYSCYLKISGLLEINSEGIQVFPLPTSKKPALFSQEYIIKMWKDNKEYVSNPHHHGDCESDEEKEHNNGWVVKSSRSFSAEEILAVKKAVIVASQGGNSVCFFMKGGGQTYIPLSDQSSLTVGDTLDLKTAKVLTLSREGKEDINRIIE